MCKTLLFVYFLSFSLMANSQTADFNYQSNNGLFCNPSSIQFTQMSSGSPVGFVWNFGNGEFSNDPNPQVTYKNPGTFTVKLIVIYMQNTVSVTKTIVINPSITTSIGYDRNYICQAGVINFTSTGSGNIAAYDWDFGDGSGIETATGNSITHNYTDFGTYNITVKATDVSGCSDTNTTVIKVQAPAISGTVSPKSGCVPANVTFNANAVIPVNSTVTNYAWSFTDGSAGTSTTANNTTHVYNAAGSYSPTVTITTSEGCSNTYSFGNIAYGTPPFNHIAYPKKTVICGSDAAVLVSKATNANSYHWNFGDGKTATVSDTVTQHKYATLGTKNITVTPFYNGCSGNPITFQIDVVGVIASYTYSNSCADKKTFSFTNTSQGNLSSVVWDFGDGSPVVNTLNAVHTFPTSGSFVTTLTVTDSITGCSDIYSRTIYTSDPFLVNTDSSICRNTITHFSIGNNYDNPAATYTWQVVGKQTAALTDSSLMIKADIFGNFNNYVIINGGAQYCKDTIPLDHKILVRGPALSYTAPASLCFKELYNVNNTSKPYLPQDSVNMWHWNFGTGSVNDTTYQPEPYLYSRAGKYNVKLFGIDINGCYDSLVKPVTVNPLPFLHVIPALDTLCEGQTDTLIAFHNESIIWSPSTGLSCATCDTVVANPSATTKYLVTATSQFGCISTDSAFVKVFPNFVATPSASDIYLCLNDSVQLSIDPPMNEIVWSPSTGLSTSNNYNPIAFPRETTTYTATITDSIGCFTRSADITVHVKSLPTVDAGPNQVYPYNSSFTLSPLYSDNVASYNWSPFNLLSCSTCPNPNGIASASVPYVITVTSDSGCIAKDSITIFVECKEANLLMPNAFTPNGDNLNDYFYPLARGGIKSIKRFSIYDRFGKLIFEKRDFFPNDKSFGWNGRVNNMDQTTSVFVYYVEALCDLGESIYKKGSVTLIR
jgi:gliding motility-associated-like protein